MSTQRRRSVESRLRRALVLGDIVPARDLAGTIAGADENALGNLDALIDGVEQIALQDDCSAGEQLLQGLSDVEVDHGVRWLSWLWRAAAGVKTGSLDLGKTAADTALAMAGPLDDTSRASTLAVRAAIDFLRGEVPTARARVVEAAALYRREDPGMHATLWLAWARILLSLGQARDGLRALNQAAQAVNEAWVNVPLARQALLAKRSEDAADILLPFAGPGQRIVGEVATMVRLVQEVSSGQIPVEVVSEYIWLTGRPLTDEVAEQLEKFLDEQSRHLTLHELFAWDLAEAGLFTRAAGYFTAIERVGDQDRIRAAREAAEVLETRRRNRRVGILDVVQTATWAKASEDRRLAADTEAELFWIRRAIGNGDLERAAADLDCLVIDKAPAVQRERVFIDAIQTGQIPLEVAREYVWIRERPITDAMLQVLCGFMNDHAPLEQLRLLFARDLREDGEDAQARTQLEWLAREGKDEQIATTARRELASMGHRRDISKKVVTGSLSPVDFVTGRLAWPSVLDSHSLLFCGDLDELPPQVTSCAEQRWVEQGQQLAVQGENGDLLYLVRSGDIRASRTRMEHHDLGSYTNVFLGEIGSLYGLPNTVSLEAAVDSEVDVISRRSMQETTRRSSAAAVLKTLRRIYFETALRICPLYTPEDEALLGRVMTTQGRWRILQRGEPASLGSRLQLAILISGVGRVVAPQKRGEVTIGFLAPGDLVPELSPSLVSIQAEKVMTLAVFDPRDLEALSSTAREALGLYLGRCIASLQTAEVLSVTELTAMSRDDDPLRTLARLAAP